MVEIIPYVESNNIMDARLQLYLLLHTDLASCMIPKELLTDKDIFRIPVQIS